MIIDNNPKNMAGVNAKAREPAYAEDLDLINERAKNIHPVLGIASPCCKIPQLLVAYKPKEKTIAAFCAQCNRLAVEIKVAEKGTAILCTNQMPTN